MSSKPLVSVSVFVLYPVPDPFGLLKRMETARNVDGSADPSTDLVMIRVLGPVDIVTRSGPRLPPGRIGRKLLGALAISANHMVSSDQLAEIIWSAAPPASWANTLQTYVYRLRRLLEPDRIVSEDHSYGLMVAAEELDALVFEMRADEAAAQRGEPQRCAGLCKEALGLWRGVAFGEFAEEDPYRLEAIRLDEIRIFVMELELEAELAMGRGEMVVGTLEALVEDYPYRERLWFLLVTALSLCGRRVEALRAIVRLRGILAEAGLEPTIDLLRLEEAIHTESTDVRPHLYQI